MAKDPHHRPAPDALLLDMYQTMGKIEAQNDQIIGEQVRANEARARILQTQSELGQRLNDFDGGSSADFRGGLKKEMGKIAELKKQLAVASLVLATIITGALQMVWYVLTHLGEIGDTVRTFVTNLLHK